MDPQTRAAVAWLLSPDEPAVQLLTRRDVLGAAAEAGTGADGVLAGAKVTALLSGQLGDGGSASSPIASGPGRTGG